MTSETNQWSNEFLNELDDARLRQAVELVRKSSASDEAKNNAVMRAESIASVAASVRRQPTPLKPARRRLAKMVLAVGVIWMIAAGVWTYQSVEEVNGKYLADASRSMDIEGGTDLNYAFSRGPETDAFYDWQLATSQVGDDWVANRWSQNLPVFNSSLAEGESTGYTHPYNGFKGRETIAMGADIQPVPSKTPQSSQKKIVQSANVSLVVKELGKTENDLSSLVQKHHAEIANAQVAQSQGQQRAARWIIRVQAESLEALLKELAGLGIAEARAINANDVTEEYIDLESRIASKKKLEQRILDVLEKKAGDIKDVLAVEEQLARIRTEIESMEGRRKYLDNMTAMSTVTVLAREQADYIPPEIDSFTNQVNHAWSGSLDVIKNFGKSLVLVLVAFGPWLPIAVVLCFGVFRMFKRRALKRMKAEG